MAATVAQLTAVLRAERGYRESGNNDTKYNRWLGKLPGYPHDGYGYAWCASFASWAYAKAGLRAGVDVPRTASCVNGVSWYRARKRWGSTPKPGAQVFYGPNGGTHTEIVIAVDSRNIRTIGGNTSGSMGGTYYNGDGVYEKVISRGESRIYGYGYPLNLGDDVALDSTDIAKIVDALVKALPKAVWKHNIAAPWVAEGGDDSWQADTHLRVMHAHVRDAERAIAEIPGKVPGATLDASAVASEVLAVLTPAAIAAAIPPELAADVVDEIKARL